MKNFVGESLGTFILVFFSCGSVAVSILFSSYSGLFQIAAIWGKVVIPGPDNGFFVVYILAPIVGGVLASLFFRGVMQPLMEIKERQSSDCCN